jgi:hypothetical protein
MEWAQRYWGAHWEIPSVQMGFEMLQRQVINDKELDILMNALDIAPGWRDPLKKISYVPLTRVDVRRMHKLGVLTDEQLIKAYRDLGYDIDNAKLLQRFTIEENKPDKSAIAEELDKLSRTTILQLYSQGTINRAVALGLLHEAGIGDAAALLYLDNADIQEENRERQANRDLIIEQAKAGVITYSQAEDKLGQLGLEAAELTRALTSLARARASATQLPSRADLDKMLKASLVTAQEYLLTLQTIGYSESWAEKYLALAMRGNG